METKLQADKRDDTGKGVARKLRASGRVPGVLYGQGTEPVALSVDAREMFHVLHGGAGGNALVELVVDGKDTLAMAREIQRDHIHNKLIHIDFLAVSRTQKITANVPVVEFGDAVGVKEGGVVEHHLREISVECFPQDMPDQIEIDITDVALGDMVHVSDLAPPGGRHDPHQPRGRGPVGDHAGRAPRRGRPLGSRRGGRRGRPGRGGRGPPRRPPPRRVGRRLPPPRRAARG